LRKVSAHLSATKASSNRWVALFVLALIVVFAKGLSLVILASEIAAGYAAKQICSGVFVARLPEHYVVEKDVLPRLATIGPVAQLLDYESDVREKSVSASMLGQQETVRYRPGYGCTLLPEGTTNLLPELSFAMPAAADASASPLPPIKTVVRFQSVLDSAFDEPPTGGRNTLAVLVMHRGELVAERYIEPVSATTPLQGWSMNKSLMATFIGRQIDQGLLGLDDSVLEALERADASDESVARVDTRLTLQHLLSMTTGFDFSERYFPGDDVTDMLYRKTAMWLSAPQRGHAYSPGEQFAYSSGDINTASMMWQQSLAGQPYAEWVREHFSAPLKLREVILEPDATGVQVGSSYAYLTARDWARMGQLWLDAWHGRSEVISAEWQRLAVTPGTAKNSEIYGLGFWLNTGHRAFPNAPENTFHAGGNSGQFVVVIPERELVVVRLGLTLNESRADMDALLADVLAAL
jgi:CubicO group peptidase (beta-lactamase class C family)